MSDIDTILANVEGHDKSATPGPWRKGVLWHDGAYPVGPYTRNEDQSTADAALIAYYRTAAPALAAEVRRLQGEVDSLRTLAAAARAQGAEEEREAILRECSARRSHCAEMRLSGGYAALDLLMVALRSRDAAGGGGR